MSMLREQARGRWQSILPHFGLPASSLNGKHGPCPICCQGKDRFRFDDQNGRGTWYCNVCGAGDGIRLVEKIRGVDFRAAVALIQPMIGAAAVRSIHPIKSDAEKRSWRNKVWLGAQPVTTEDAAGRFLQSRAGVLSYPRALRFHPSLDHRDADGRCTRHPCMIAMVSGPDGRPSNLHRTYLTADGSKATLAEPRLMMPGEIPSGAAIRLSSPFDVLGIAEGIETAFAATALFGIPCWSAVNATMLVKWTPPPEVRHLVIFGDNDFNFAGQTAAYTLARAIIKMSLATVEVRIPRCGRARLERCVTRRWPA